ncbi:hypothetical protein FQR65_LT09509 [Abscondita terminalis]|nr:hypothetical protein FQR65_LT09509 [Abscondita terminalis]
MSAQYHFVEKGNCKNNIIVDSAVLVEDGVVWDQGEVEMSLNYASNDITLIENNNESYLTATDGNDTQYFSVLETTNEATLGDLNDITLYTNGGDVEISDQQDVNSLDEQQSIYAVGTSDDLYAFQVAYDEDGNMQRYRYVLRLNENGLLESVPESLELLPVEQEIELTENQVVATEVPEEEDENEKLEGNIIVKKEEYVAEYDDEDDLDNSSNNNEDSYEDLQVNDDDNDYYEENENYEDSEETKAGILNQLGIQKVESATYQSEESNCAFESENFIETNPEEIPQDNIVESPNNSQIQSVEGDLGTFEQVYELESEISSNVQETVEEEEDEAQEPQLLIADHHHQIEDNDDGDTCKSPNSIVDHNQFKANENVEFIEELNENESDNDEFQIVDGVHVTADTDSNEEVINTMNTFIDNDAQHTIKLQDNVLQSTEPKTKNSFNKINTKANNKNMMYYVIKHPEKENVGSITQHVNNKIIKTNPRSVLKSSFAFFEQKKEKEKTVVQSIKIDKKPVKNRENSQARILHNYIAKTTIIHAPVRQERLPRKQTIKPVTRADEEIIVQEVVVSSNGIIETSEDGVVKSKVPLKPTEFLQLTDSDEEYNSKREQKRKKKRKKRKSKVPEIVISDSEDGTSDVVQIDLSLESDHDTDKSEKENQKGEGEPVELSESNSSGALADGTKRKRGRPRKRLSSRSSEAAGDTSTSSKKFKSSNDSESSDLSPSKTELRSFKTYLKCAPCSKSFPSHASLKTHMQYHQPNNKNRETFKKPTGTVPKPNNYKCIVCHETFKNNYLLTKHTKEHNEDNKIECGICKKLFSDHLQLNNHKRSHVKEQMFNSTTLPKHSPKRKSLGNQLKVPNTDSKYKCIYCTKVFTSQLLLNSHLRTHKRFACLTCKTNFISKLSLEDHVQNSCVKQFKTPRKQLLFKTGTTLATPVRSASFRRKSVVKNNEEKSNSTSSDKDKKKVSSSFNLECDGCSMTFKSHTSLFNHKVLKHGLSTPVKNVKPNKTKKLLHKESEKYSSIPPGSKLQNAFSKLRTP